MRARAVWVAVALAVVLGGCDQSKRACDKLKALEVAELGTTDGSPVMEQLQRTKHAVCVMHFDAIKKDNEADYEAALQCTELGTYTRASQCIDALTKPAPNRSSAMPPVR